MSLSIEYLCRESARIRKKYGESDPWRLAAAMNIVVHLKEMGKKPTACKGFYLYKQRKHVITINSCLSERMRQIVLMHELGHVVLHRNVPKPMGFRDFLLFDRTDTYEYEANMFAAEYLLDDDAVISLLNDDTFFNYAAENLRVPPELLDFKFRILKSKGYKIEPQYIASGDFLRKLKDRGDDEE
ncbi:MAG: ImmA/IrrE family metallo-endopeptidase [Gracilibacteraceae bacterium]|nr:ImmA/IrrE family metallo-endopeptidase [Gracilibacteraceae bacterium]